MDSWTEDCRLNTARRQCRRNFTTALVWWLTHQCSALAETWNGQSWTEVGDLNTARKYVGECRNINSSLAYWRSSMQPGTGTIWTWTDMAEAEM